MDYVYDLVGKIQQVNDPTGTYAFAYDNMGQLIGTATSYSFLPGRTFTTSYTYDAASDRTGFTDPEGGTTAYAYDTVNRLTTLTPPTAFGAGSFGFSYDALSRRTQLTRPNGVTTSYTYDTLSRLLSVLHQLAGSTIDGATYTVDNAGNRTAKTDQRTAVATSYGYDNIYQLLSATQGATTTESYAYDAVGNRTSSLGVASYTTNSSNEMTANSNASFTYDNNGNELTKVDSTGTTSYAWDYENRLTSVTLPGSGGTVSFSYDPFGRHIKKSSSTATSVFAFDGDDPIEETTASGAVVARYAQTQNIDEPLAMLRSSTTSFYLADGLGSITSLSGGAGTLAQTYGYDSFGKQLNSAGSLTNPFQFSAREFDSETGLYYYRARYFDPASGRFISEDPIRFDGGVNFYSYTGNSPLNWYDPFGLDWIRYTGQVLTLYKGNFGDTSNPLEGCAATSGTLPLQSPKYQHTVSGPLPEGTWRINLGLDPTRGVGVNRDGTSKPGLGVQWLGPGSPDWGTWRARLEKVSVQDNRVNTFYLHNSHKGFTHGCVETCDDLYQKFVDYHNQGVGYIYVDVRYAGASTNGGTKQ